MPVCKTVDDFIRDKLRWVVELSNGETVYEDDDRPGEDPPSAWVRLRAYCHDNRLHVVGMRLQFRTHIVGVGPDEGIPDGFYFVKSAYGIMGVDGRQENYGAYIAGYLKDGKIFVTRWKTPELEQLGHEVREHQADSLSLIEKKH